MLRDVPIRYLLVAAFLVCGLAPLTAASLLSLSTARDEQRDQAFRHLESVRDIKASQLERFFQERVNQIEVLAADPYVRVAVRDFEALRGPDGFASLGLAGRDAGRFDASDAYRRVHDRHAAWFGLYARRAACYDVFLMDPADGFSFFTVQKEQDFGLEVANVDSPLRDVWASARAGQAAVSDTRLYAPSRGLPAQFLAAPVQEDGRVIGVIAIQLSLDAIDGIMGERSGMGRTGETYVVGPDFRMRSDSSLDPAGHGVVASFRGDPERNGAPTAAVRAAFAGNTGSLRTVNYGGEAVLSAFAPVRFQGVTWALVAEVGEAEIEGRIAEALDVPIGLILGLAILLVGTLSIALSQLVSRGVRHVLAELGLSIERVLQGRLDARLDPADAPTDFRGVVDHTNRLIDAFERQAGQKRRLEATVEGARRMEALGTLAGGIAHDFNNILAYMYNYAALLDAELPPGSRGHEHLAGLETGIQHATELVSQVLAFGRPARREAAPVKVALVVKEALALLKTVLPSNVTMIRRLEDESIYVAGDPSELLRVVASLCTNAWQAMKAGGGTLTVTLRRAAEADAAGPGTAGAPCLLEIADTGAGMDEATRERAFEPFFTTKPVGEGTGMGLAVVHGIVRALGGTIRLDSAPGRGTRAVVCLPTCAAPEQVAPPREAGTLRRGSGRLLLVDDEDEILRSGRPILEGLGYDVRTASSGAEAEASVRAAPAAFDLVVTDLTMPGFNGIELARRVHAIRPDLPIVLVTGYADRLAGSEADDAGIVAVLRKPWDLVELSRVLDGFAERDPATRQTRPG